MVGNIKNIYKYKTVILAFIIIELLLYFLVSIDKQNRINEYLADASQSYDSKFNIVLRSFEDKADVAYETLINSQSVKELFQQAVDADDKQRTVLRTRLYNLLQPKYEQLKKFGFKQVQFHLPDNHSFLRMHAPGKFGDDLADFRKTVVYVNTTHKKIGGFEEGIANNGFRYVFPLFDNESYIGSVELSFSAYALAEYIKDDAFETRFIIDKKVLLTNKYDKLADHYIVSSIDDDYVIDKRYLSTKIQLSHEESLHKYYIQIGNQSFSTVMKFENKIYIESFIPIKNSVTKKINAYLVIVSNGKYIDKITQNFWTIYFILSLVVFLSFMRYIRGKKYRKKIQKQNRQLALSNKKSKAIIDSQDYMIIVTNVNQMIDVNTKVLDFFGFASLEDMKKDYACICDFFIKHDEYFHLGLVPKGENWINYMQTLAEKKHVVNMIGKDMEAKAYQVKINHYSSNGNSIISFRDITDIILEQKFLQYKANHDRLTNIYNRQKIDESMQELCAYSARRKEQVAIIMFDIDHFKKINDNYGHAKGDEVLKTIADVTKNNIRKEDIFGRWGGEEFLLIMRHTTIDEAYNKAKRLRVILEEYQHKDLPKITASFGVSALQPNDTPKSLFKKVDKMLYKAKENGRNCVMMDKSISKLPQTLSQ